MEQTPNKNTESMQRANQTAIYRSLIIGIFVGLVGVYLRFANDSTALSLVSWLILCIGAFLCCRSVFKILGA